MLAHITGFLSLLQHTILSLLHTQFFYFVQNPQTVLSVQASCKQLIQLQSECTRTEMLAKTTTATCTQHAASAAVRPRRRHATHTCLHAHAHANSTAAGSPHPHPQHPHPHQQTEQLQGPGTPVEVAAQPKKRRGRKPKLQTTDSVTAAQNAPVRKKASRSRKAAADTVAQSVEASVSSNTEGHTASDAAHRDTTGQQSARQAAQSVPGVYRG